MRVTLVVVAMAMVVVVAMVVSATFSSMGQQVEKNVAKHSANSKSNKCP